MGGHDDYPQVLQAALVAARNRVEADQRANQAARNLLMHAAEGASEKIVFLEPATVVAETTLMAELTVIRASYTAGARHWLRFVEVLVPARLRQEELGDAFEVINRLAREAEPGWRWLVAAKVVTTFFWVIVNAVRDVAAGLRGRSA